MIKQNSSLSTSPTSGKFSTSKNTIGVVVDVVLDESNKWIKEKMPELEIGKNTSVVGAVLVTDTSDFRTRDEQFTLALPYDRNFINLPIKNDVVELIHTGGKIYYKNIQPTTNPNQTANKKTIGEHRKYFDQIDGTSTRPSAGYNTVLKSGPNTNSAAPFDDENYGKHYKIDTNLHRLKLYEGDTLIESRFGQSVRFSGYDNKDNKMYPAITIRNRENELSKSEKKTGEFTLEDVNRDGSIISISSGKKIIPFLPGTIDKSGKSDFVTKPISFQNFPKTLDGDQIIMNTGRIVLSSRNKEMIFYSKSNMGVIGDSEWSWDFAKGITGDIGGNWHVTTNNYDFRVFAGFKGRCILGSGDNLQNIPKGNDLIKWLGELVDLIMTNIYATPAGPTKPGPQNNNPKLAKLKAQLPTLLSKLNYTGNDPGSSRVGKDFKPPTEDEALQKHDEINNTPSAQLLSTIPANQNTAANALTATTLTGTGLITDDGQPPSESENQIIKALPSDKTKFTETPTPVNSPYATPIQTPKKVECNSNSLNYDEQLSSTYKVRNLSIAATFQHTIKPQWGLTNGEIVCNLKNLTQNVIEPLRAKYPGLIINSGFRTSTGKKSQHQVGEAVDIQWPKISPSEYLERSKWAVENLPFDQFIFEHGKSIWLHISLKRTGSQRRQVLTMYKNKYQPGLKLYYK